jgi:nucleoside phosphorylase
MRVLLVDDDRTKGTLVVNALVSGGVSQQEIDWAYCANEAKAKMRSEKYDLVVLDLALPTWPAGPPEVDGGTKLLEELTERDGYHVPGEVIGLTAYQDLRDDALEIFADHVWSVIVFDRASEYWASQIRRKVQHLVLATSNAGPLAHKSFACIITALDKELDAIHRGPWNWLPFDCPGDVSLYSECTVDTRSGSQKIFATVAPRMGMPASALTAAKMIELFRPQYLIMFGIAAGVSGRCELGDVIVADPTWDWGSGKIESSDGGPMLKPAPHQLPLHSALRIKVQKLARDRSLLAAIKDAWPAAKPAHELSVRIGPVASGAAVLADRETLLAIKQQHRKLLSVEMESYGVYAAAYESRIPQPLPISLKAICDFADENKDDSHQEYAAYTSAAVTRALVEKFL